MINNKRLKKLRKEAGLIQADVAAKLNIKRESYTRYETGDIQPPNDQIIKLANLFNVSSDYLLNLSDDPSPMEKKETPTSEQLLRQFMEINDLSEESRKDLTKYLDMLKLRDKMKKYNEEVSEELRPKLI